MKGGLEGKAPIPPCQSNSSLAESCQAGGSAAAPCWRLPGFASRSAHCDETNGAGALAMSPCHSGLAGLRYGDG